MRFTIEKNIFLKKLEIVNRIIPNQSINNNLFFIKIILNNKKIELIGHNETTSIYTFIESENIYNCKDGSTLIKAKFFLEIIKKISDEKFTLEVLEKDSIIEISDSNKKTSFKLKCLDKEIEYPIFNPISLEKKINITVSNLINSINKTYFAASSKNNYPILNAINIKTKNKEIYFTTSDSFRCARIKNQINDSSDFNINVPVKTMFEMSNILEIIENKNKNLEISTDQTKIIFNCQDIIISSNLIKGDFPDIKIFDNNENKFSVKIQAKLFLESLDRTLILSDEEKIVKLKINKNKIELFANLNDIGNITEIVDQKEFNNFDNEFEIYFNGKYVMDAVKSLRMNNSNFEQDFIEFQFISKNKPFIIKNTSDNNLIQVIAPISE